MAEYCKQCFDKHASDTTAPTLTAKRKEMIECGDCGETIVDSKGRCTGACGKNEHSSPFMTYIFETRPPGFEFVALRSNTPKGKFFKFVIDAIQWIPRATFFFSLIYMFFMAIFLRILELKKKPEELEKMAELACARASNAYSHSLDLWYKAGMRLENLFFG